MAFDPSSYVSQPFNPLGWAQLNESARQDFTSKLQAGEAGRRSQAQFDVSAELEGQRADEAHRANVAREQFAAEQARVAAEKEDYDRKVKLYAEKKNIFSTAKSAKEVREAYRQLAESGLALVPGRADQGMPAREQGAPQGQARPSQVDQDYNAALESLGGPPGSAQLPKPGPGRPDMTGTAAQGGGGARPLPSVPPEDNLTVTEGPVPKLPKAPPTNDEIRAILREPIPDIPGEAQAEMEERNKQRFEEGAARIKAFRMTDPVVEGEALNMLATANGQPLPAPTYVAPPPQAAPDPNQPPGAQGMPVDSIPVDVLDVIAEYSQPDDDFLSESLAQGGFHTVDTDTGAVVSPWESWQEIHDEAIQRRREAAMTIVEQMPPGHTRDMFEARANAAAMGDPEATKILEMYLDLQESGLDRQGRLEAARASAGLRVDANDRADEGAGLSKRKTVLSAVKDITARLTANMDFKKWATAERTMKATLERLRNEPNVQEKVIIFREIMKAAEGKSPTDADAKAYMGAGGKWMKFDEALRSFDDGDMSPKRIKMIEEMVAKSNATFARQAAALGKKLHDSITQGADLRFIDPSLTDEQIKAFADSEVSMTIPSVNFGSGKGNGKGVGGVTKKEADEGIEVDE